MFVIFNLTTTIKRQIIIGANVVSGGAVQRYGGCWCESSTINKILGDKDSKIKNRILVRGYNRVVLGSSKLIHMSSVKQRVLYKVKGGRAKTKDCLQKDSPSGDPLNVLETKHSNL